MLALKFFLWQVQHQPIPGQVNIIREFGLNICMESDLVRHMGEITNRHPELLHHIHGLTQGEMRDMLLFPQGIQDQYLRTTDLILLLLLDPVGIGDIGKIAKAEAQVQAFSYARP